MGCPSRKEKGVAFVAVHQASHQVLAARVGKGEAAERVALLEYEDNAESCALVDDGCLGRRIVGRVWSNLGGDRIILREVSPEYCRVTRKDPLKERRSRDHLKMHAA